MMKSVATLARVIATSFISTMLRCRHPRSLSILPDSTMMMVDASSSSSPSMMTTRNKSSSSSIGGGGMMVTKLYEIALVGWKNNHHHHAATAAATAGTKSVGSSSRQSMAFISDKLVITTPTTSQHDTAANNWGMKRGQRRQGTPLLQSSSFTTTNATSSSSSRSFSTKLSSTRAQNAIALLPTYLQDARSVQKFHPITAPHGALQLSVAENQLCELPIRGVVALVEMNKKNNHHDDSCYDNDNVDIGEEMTLVQVLSQLASSTIPRPSSSSSSSSSSRDTLTFEKEMIYYQPTQGSPGLRSVMASYLHNLLLSTTTTTTTSSSSTTTSSSSLVTFNPNNIILGAGCNAVLENLCFCLTEPGDAVMIPTPYYAAFEFDLVARAGCTIVPVNTLEFQDVPLPSSSSSVSSSFHLNNTSEHNNNNNNNKRMTTTTTTTIPPSFYYPTKSSLNHAYNLAIQQTSRPPRVLLLSHPNNPLGICYPPNVMMECIEWCREKGVHLISDEIYAGSVYRQRKTKEIMEEEEEEIMMTTTTSSNDDDDGSSSSSSSSSSSGGDTTTTFVSAMSLASSLSSSSITTSSSSSSTGEEKKDDERVVAGGNGGDEGERLLGLGPYIHLVYALSKDFALSGLRVGVAYTENEEILLPMQKLNDLCQISSQTQLLVERMLSAHVVVVKGGGSGSDSDKEKKKVEKFVDVYLKSNQSNIQKRCDKLQSCLSDIGIPHLPADSGLFVWMDFREFLPPLLPNDNDSSSSSSITEETESLHSKEQRERVLYLKLMKEYGLLFTPGMSMRNERPGFFRCVFTAASEEEFDLGLERICRFVKEQREGINN